MTQNHYQAPLHFKSLFEDGNHQLAHCTLMESIDQHLELLLTTCPGEHAFDAEYGCRIWDMDFERVLSKSQWEETFSSYIKEAVVNFEKRITEVEIKILMKDIQWDDALFKTTTVRKRVEVIVLGYLRENGQKCGFRYTLYMGPLATE